MRSIVALAMILTICLTTSADAAVLAYWRFEEGNGSTAFDSSGNGNTGIISTSGLYSTNVPSTLFPDDYSLQLSGNGQFMIAGDSPSLRPSSAVTVEAYVRLDQSLAADLGAAVVARPGVGNGNQYAMGVRGHSGTSTGDFPFFTVLNAAGDGLAVDLSTPLQVGQWYHLAGVYDGTEMRLYVDGVLSGVTPFAGGPITYAQSNPLYIGADVDSGSIAAFFPGAIDEVRISDVALPPSDFLNAVPEVSSVLLSLFGMSGPLGILVARRQFRR